MQITHAVLYHAKCYDGFGCAHIIHRVFEKEGIVSDYIPCYHGAKLSESFFHALERKIIYVVDFSFDYETTLRLMNASKSFLVLDHHETSEAALSRIPIQNKIFRKDKSGVGIVWDYFHPGERMPLFLSYIQDRDLWKNEMKDCQAFIAHFYTLPFDFKVWDEYEDGGGYSIFTSINLGKTILDYKNVLIEECMRKVSVRTHVSLESDFTVSSSCTIAYVNGVPPSLISDVASKVLEKYELVDFCSVVNQNLETEETNFSLRSRNGGFDVSEIAVKLGGGGHASAAGINQRSLDPFLKLGEITFHLPKNYYIKGDVVDDVVILKNVGRPPRVVIELLQTPLVVKLFKKAYGDNIKAVNAQSKHGATYVSL